MSIKMTEDEYLFSKGYGFPISDYMLDKLRIPHGLTARQCKKLENDNSKAANEYATKRSEARKEYYDLVEQGVIIPKTRIEQTIERAKYGHPDNESTQAARRICEKKRIDWRSI